MKLILGDAIKELNKLPDESIDFIITDPPYYIQEEVSIIRRGNRMKYKGKDIDFKKETDWDRIWNSEEEYLDWLREVIKEFSRVLKQNRHCIIFCDKKKISFIGKIGEEFGLKFRTPWAIRYTNPVPQARKISPTKSLQLAYWGTKGEVKVQFYNWQLGMINDVIDCSIPRNEGSPIRHPTQKPLKMALYLVAFLSKPNDIVLDPFAGVGTFPLACLLLKRDFIAIEINEKYFQAMEKRLKNLSNPSVQKIHSDFINECLINCSRKVPKNEVYQLLGLNGGNYDLRFL